jgi:ATP-dependent Lon protease
VVTPEVSARFWASPGYRLEKEVEERVSGQERFDRGWCGLPSGGDIVFIEATNMRGGKQFTMTGHLGEVMQESMRAALSWVRANADRYGIDPDFFRKQDIHIHVPSGAIPKDGPSAGVAMVTALVSLLSGRSGSSVRGDDRRNFSLRNRASGGRDQGKSPGREACRD